MKILLGLPFAGVTADGVPSRERTPPAVASRRSIFGGTGVSDFFVRN
jgi:hypothetical protein